MPDGALWAQTGKDELWCSRNGNHWTPVPLDLPPSLSKVTVESLWRGQSKTLYVVISDSGKNVERLLRIANVTQCKE